MLELRKVGGRETKVDKEACTASTQNRIEQGGDGGQGEEKWGNKGQRF